MEIIRKYLLREVLGVFVLSLAIVTMLFMSQKIIQLTEWAINRGVGAYQVGGLLVYLLPFLMMIIIPIVTLFSILLGVGRLSSDNEIVAMKAAGIGLYRLAPPIIIFAVLAAVLALFNSQALAPRAARSTRMAYFKITRTRTEAVVTERMFVKAPSSNPVSIYARRKMPDGELRGLMVAMENRPDDGDWAVRQFAFARSGRFVHDPVRLVNELWMFGGTLIQEDRESGRNDFADFETFRFKLSLKRLKEKRKDVLKELGPMEMRAEIKKLSEKAARGELSKSGKKELLELRITWHERLAFPVACLALCFWALPLGVQPPRAGRARAIVVSLTLSGVFYYLMILGKFMALRRGMDPAIAIWFPNAVIFLSGLYMLRQKNQERPIFILSWLEDYAYYSYDRVRELIEETGWDPLGSIKAKLRAAASKLFGEGRMKRDGRVIKIVDRYVLSSYLKAFTGSVIGVSVLFTVLGVLDSLTYQLGKEGVTVYDIVRFYLLQLPQTVFMGAPFAALLSAMITLGAMNQGHEIMALRASGFSVARVTAPILVATLMIGVLLFVLGNTLVPVGVRAFNQARQEASVKRVSPNQRIWYVSEKGGEPPTLLRIERVDESTGDLIGVTVIPVDEDFIPIEEIVADRGTYEGDRRWRLTGVERRRFTAFEPPSIERLEKLSITLSETPDELQKAQRPSEEMSWSELGERIVKAGRYGRSPNPYKVERQSRLAIPLAALILVLVGAPLSIRPIRAGGLAVGILGAFVIGFGYFVIIALFITMGKGDLLPPWAAAWTANIIFGIIGGLYFSTLRK